MASRFQMKQQQQQQLPGTMRFDVPAANGLSIALLKTTVKPSHLETDDWVLYSAGGRGSRQCLLFSVTQTQRPDLFMFHIDIRGAHVSDLPHIGPRAVEGYVV